MEDVENNRKSPKEFQLNDFEIGCPLGRGKFGRVYLAREKKTKFIVAIKTLFLSELKRHRMELQVIRESEINAHMDHPNILKMFTSFMDDRRLYLVLEYAGLGELFTILQEKKDRRFPDPQAAKYTFQVASALEYCHSKGVLHRDIKPENLLLDINDNIKLADFGWSVHSPKNKRNTLCGTLDYLPPEMVKRTPYNKLVDNWCLGILCFEFLTGNPPFESSNQEITYHKITNLEIIYPIHMNINAKHLIKSLLKLNPNERLPLKDVMTHKWIVENKDLPYPKPSKE